MAHEKNKPAVLITRFPYESAWGGEESHTLAVARHLRLKGIEVVFMGSCPVLTKKFRAEGFPVHKVWGGRMIVTPWLLLLSFFLFPFLIWNLRRHFRSLRKQYEINALYCLSLNEKLFLSGWVASKYQIPVTWVEHQELRNWLTKNPWKGRYIKNAQLAKIVPICLHNRQLLESDFNIPKVHISNICNGVDVQTLEALDRKTESGLVLYANRLIPKKGVEEFLEAIPLIKDFEKLHFMIVGDGELQETVKKKVSELKKKTGITSHDILKKEKWFELLSRTDVFVCCSRDTSETFSLNTAEAMATGCKVVVTRPCGITEFLTDKQDSFLIEPNNPSLLAQSIQQALSSSGKIRAEAQKTAREKFNLVDMLVQYTDLILRSL